MLVTRYQKLTLNLKKNEKIELVKRSGILSPEEASKPSKARKSRTPNLIKGKKFVLVTGPLIRQLEIHPLDFFSDEEISFTISNENILSMLLIAQSALPNQFITSN